MSRIFAGNYCVSNPCRDECISGIKGIADKYIIQGNVEKYPEKLVGQEPALDRPEVPVPNALVVSDMQKLVGGKLCVLPILPQTHTRFHKILLKSHIDGILKYHL